MFYTAKRYDLSKVGRYKVEQKLGRDYGEKDAESIHNRGRRNVENR